MTSVLVQRGSEKIRKIESNYVIWILSVAAIILFILTVDSLTITDMQPYGFYFLRVLPVYYWAGVGVTIASIVVSFAYDTRQKNDLRIVPILLLALFIYGTPVFTYEVPRFTDVFGHGSEALPILSSGTIDLEDRYAREYPTTFILLGVSTILQGVDPLTLIRFAELFTILLVVTFVYSIARISNSRFAVIAPLGFIGAFWVDQGHYSPQGLALIFYMVFFFSLVKAIYAKESRRGWLIAAFVMLLAINFTSPTNSLFLLLNLATITAVSFMVFRRSSTVSNRVIVVMAIAGSLFLSWSIYNAESRTINKIEEFGQKLEADLGTDRLALTPSPSESYQAVNTIRTGVVAFVVASGAGLSIVMLRKERTHYVLILVGWFATASFIAISVYLSPVLLSRNFMYVSIAWAVLLATFFSRTYFRRDVVVKMAILSIVVALVLAIPATRYGRDPTTYASSSLVNAASVLAGASEGGERVISYFIGSLVSKYFAADNGIAIQELTFDTIFQVSYAKNNMNATANWIHSQSVINSRVIFSEPERNNIVMKYNQPELYDTLEEGVREDQNLIINNGSTRVYSSTSTILPSR